MPLQKVATTKTNDAFYDYKFNVDGRDETFFVRKNRDGKWENSFDLQTFDRKRDAVNYVVDYFKKDLPVYQFGRRKKPGAASFEHRKKYHPAYNPNDIASFVSNYVDGWDTSHPLIVIIDAPKTATKVVKADMSPEMFRSVFKEGTESCAVVVRDFAHKERAQQVKDALSDVGIQVVDMVNHCTRQSIL